MPEDLVFENDKGDQITEIAYRRTIKGIPSKITNFYLRNLSNDLNFQGYLNVVPTEGRSYSEDVYISQFGNDWVRTTEFNVPPKERIEFKIRAKPVNTPPSNTGRASITITKGTLLGWH